MPSCLPSVALLLTRLLACRFTNLAAKIEALDLADSTAAGRRMQQLINALEEVEQYHQIDSSLQIKQFIAEARATLKQVSEATSRAIAGCMRTARDSAAVHSEEETRRR
eukprot:SAG22_NODE_1947_length_3277_cov_1.880743_7_plen_109_part_00